MERRALVDVSNQFSSLQQNGKKALVAAGKPEDVKREKKITSRIASPGKDVDSVSPTCMTIRPATPSLDDFDREVEKDIRYVCEYAKEIHDNYLLKEAKHLPSANYMSKQTDITARMRAILIDWIVEVHQKFKMQPQTLYICVNILDRYLERKVVKRDELQLIGCAALWTASKIEEIYSPEVQDFVHISDRAFKRSDLLAMEGQMLNVLDFKLTFPTHFVFLTRWARVADADKKQKLFASYCVERTLQEYSFLRYKPSLIAAAGVYLAMETAPCGSNQLWTQLLEKHTSYTDVDLQECVKEMRDVIADAEHRSLLAVRKKYNTEENGFVARINVHKEE